MAQIIDRRTEPDKRYYSSRDRFLKKNRKAIKKAIENSIEKGSIGNIGKGGVDVTVPDDGISEPIIHHGQGGKTDTVLPGNKRFNGGDVIPRPKGGGQGGSGKKPSDDGDGEDEFTFAVSEEEFLKILFEDLALPNLNKKNADDAEMTVPKRSGFVSEGAPNKLDLVRSFTLKKGRVMAVNKKHNRDEIECLKSICGIITEYLPKKQVAGLENFYALADRLPTNKRLHAYQNRVKELLAGAGETLPETAKADIEDIQSDIQAIEKRISKIPQWNESTDLRYRHHVQIPVPATKAAMFCMMDVSASMDQERKNNAKLFYMLLYRFLKQNYQQVDVVFIRHTHVAEEVDEETFFYDRKTGGTRVSSALEKMEEIAIQRYPVSEWNIYGAQASDGENFGGDSEYCVELVENRLLPLVQGYFYTEIQEGPDEDLWYAYEHLPHKYAGKFFMGKVEERKDIFPIFRDFFQKREDKLYQPAAALAAFSKLTP